MPEETLTLHEAAEKLGVHYMTAYRYVRLGLLAASKRGPVWEVPRLEVDRLLAERGGVGAPRRRAGRGAERAPWAARLESRLRAGDERGAWGVVEAALASGAEPAEVYLALLVPALRNIGEAWATGEIDVAVEHQASVIVMRLVGRLGPRFNRRGQSRGSVVLGAPPNDHHGLPTALLADLARGAGFTVVDLGADVPAGSFVRAALAAERLLAVAIGSSTHGNDDGIKAVTAALHEHVPGVPVLVGGSAVRDADHATWLGGDGWALDGVDALALLEGITTTSA